MSFISDIGGSLVTAITGVNQSQIQSSLDAAEQSLTLVAEAVVFLLAIIAIELAILIRVQR